MRFSCDGVTRTRFTLPPKTTKTEKKDNIYETGFEDIRHQAMKGSDHERRGAKEVSPMNAPVYGFDKVFRQQCREGRPRLSSVNFLSGRDVAESSESLRQLQLRGHRSECCMERKP